MALDGHTDLDDASAEDDHADGFDRAENEVGQISDHGNGITVGGKGAGGQEYHAEYNYTPYGHKYFCAFSSRFLHSFSSIIDNKYRISYRQCGLWT